jgi:hypothetical protein
MDAFLAAIDRHESRQLANLLSVIATGSQGDGKAIARMLKELQCSKSP